MIYHNFWVEIDSFPLEGQDLDPIFDISRKFKAKNVKLLGKLHLKGPVSGFVGHIPLPSLDSIITRNP